MSKNDKIETYLKTFGQLKEKRTPFDSYWGMLAPYLIPDRADLLNQYATLKAGSDKSLIYDSTPEQALDLFSSSLVGYLANPAMQWFKLRATNDKLMENKEVAKWYEDASQILLDAFNDDSAGFYTNLKKATDDLGALGSTGMLVMPGKKSDLSFTQIIIGELYVSEDDTGTIDTVYRKVKKTLRQAALRYGKNKLSKDARDKLKEKPEDMIDILQIIEPRARYDDRKKDQKNKPIAYYHIEIDKKHLLSEEGFNHNPLPIGRWDVTAGNVYGTGPSSAAFADIKQLHAMERALIFAAEKQLNPPLQGPSDGFLGNIDLTAGAYNSNSSQNQQKIEPIFSVGDVSVTLDMLERKRDSIRRAFYNDQLQLVGGAQMTATEVMERMEEKMRLMAPMIGRVQTELLGPIITRAFHILLEKGRFPAMPKALSGSEMRTVYSTALQRSQKASETNAIAQFLGEAIELSQAAPEVLDRINIDAAIKEIHKLRSLSQDILRTEEEVSALREQAQEKQAAAESMEMMGQGASVAKDASQAGLI
ncbi:MAG: portal protein [Rickettsiales bacterium]|nr:portal protein [Rickettsiales bacterium]